MQRRKLLLETLEVDSFVVGPASPRIGTVRAFADAIALDGDFADQPVAEPKYTEEGYPAHTCTGPIACTLPGVCTCLVSCEPVPCTTDARCV
ncbi:MAG TPA: hypothetical protein VF092_25910 [Longimicrobium sp.]